MTELGLKANAWYRYEFYDSGGTLIYIHTASPRTIRYSEYTYELTNNDDILALGCLLEITEEVNRLITRKKNRKDGDDLQIEVIGDFGTPRIITLDECHRLHTSNESDFALSIYNPFKLSDLSDKVIKL